MRSSGFDGSNETDTNAEVRSLNIRSVCKDDLPAVRRIFRSHFRSLSPAALRYYIFQQFQDLAVIFVICKIFVSWTDLLKIAILFLGYIWLRATLEMEWYIYRRCPDLDDIMGSYMSSSSGRSHFWVAEVEDIADVKDDSARNGKLSQRQQSSSSTENSSAKSRQKRIVGCVGICSYRSDPSRVAQLIRLVVAQDARRMRIGSRLLAQFENYAREKGFQEVRLYTNNLNTSHVKFIRQHGYEVQTTINRGSLRGDLLQWRKVLLDLNSSQHPSPNLDGIVRHARGSRGEEVMD